MEGVKLVVAHCERICDDQPTNRSRHRLSQKVTTEIYESGAISRQQPFVTGRAERIDLHFLHVNRESACRLTRINHERMAIDVKEMKIDALCATDRKSTRLNSSH